LANSNWQLAKANLNRRRSQRRQRAGTVFLPITNG
jgi:hypothetical protein